MSMHGCSSSDFRGGTFRDSGGVQSHGKTGPPSTAFSRSRAFRSQANDETAAIYHSARHAFPFFLSFLPRKRVIFPKLQDPATRSLRERGLSVERSTMNFITHQLQTAATSSSFSFFACACMLATTAGAAPSSFLMQATPPAPAHASDVKDATATDAILDAHSPEAASIDADSIKRLAKLRSTILSIERELNSPNLLTDSLDDLQRALSIRTSEMKEHRALCANTFVRIPIDPALIALSNQTRLRFDEGPISRSRITHTFVSKFIADVAEELAARNSSVTCELDAPLSMVRLSGMQWEVEEAKAALKEALPAYIARIQTLEAADRTSRMVLEDQELARLVRSTVNIAWEGGTLEDLVARVQSSVRCNVVLADASVGSLTIPPLAVERVRPEVFFLALQSIPLADNAGLVVTVVAQDQKLPEQKSPEQKSSEQGADLGTLPVVVISREFNANASVSYMEQRLFDLTDWEGINAGGIESLINAINFAMESTESEQIVKIRYHEPTKLLFVKGPTDSIELIKEIVRSSKK